MKKIMILTVVAVAASSIGCCRGGPRTSWFRGDACNDCATYETTPNYSGYNANISGAPEAYNSGVVVPNLPLPGPSTNE